MLLSEVYSPETGFEEVWPISNGKSAYVNRFQKLLDHGLYGSEL